MEGYFNFGFTNSVRKSSAWFLSQRATESNYKIDVEWSCDSVQRNSMEDVDTIDTDLDSDSFLSDLEKDSGEQRGEGGERSQRYSHRDWEEAVQRTSNGQSQQREDREERGEREERSEVRREESLAANLSQVGGGEERRHLWTRLEVEWREDSQQHGGSWRGLRMLLCPHPT